MLQQPLPRGKNSVCSVLTIIVLLLAAGRAQPGEIPRANGYKVLAPIVHGNLTIFPVVASSTHDASEFITLDEGLRSGEVVITEAGRVPPLIRGPREQTWQYRQSGAQVNQLALVNNSKHPLLLLAGEIVTGGKQDRIIGKDRIVPAGSDPIDLNVFCVEHGRWTATSDKFGAFGSSMAQPSVRASAMAAKSQQQVWDRVESVHGALAASAPVAGGSGSGSAGGIGNTTSYARVMENREVKQQVDAVATPVVHDFENVIRELRERNAVGVVVAVNGEIIWADVFPSTALLQKYWLKLARSYAAESVVSRAAMKHPDVPDAQKFLDDLGGTREVAESEPGVYRHVEITGPGFKVFELTSLLPKTGFDLHLAKMAEQ
jgi:hypothetical protein